MTPREAFVAACTLDVQVRKPGNVSLASPGHRMVAAQFVDSARAAAGPLFSPGAPLGERVERAVRASWAAAGCNTNLGIVLLCAPLAIAAEQGVAPAAVLQRLDAADAQAVFRAIAAANPGGLGEVPQADVRAAPSIGLVDAMALAAPRDLVARQYSHGMADVLAAADTLRRSGFALARAGESEVQRVYLHWLGAFPDSHIVRKHGEAVAQNVMAAAQRWQGHPAPGADPAFAAWDETLKGAGINPGTSADLSVATLLAAELAPAWHGT